MAKRKKIARDPYKKYKNNLVTVYMMAMMLIYVLYCKHGYVNFDYEKAVVLYTITGIFVAAAGVLFVMSALAYDGLKRVRQDMMLTDYLVFALVISWIIAFAAADDKVTVFWGDSVRGLGLLFHLSFMAAFLIISHWGEWNRALTVTFLIMCAGEWTLQIFQYFGKDIFNWQLNHQYPYLIGTLGAVDQNAYFDGIVLTILMCLFLFENRKIWKAVYGIAVFVGFIAGIESNADSFTAAFGMGIVVMFGYCLYRSKKLLDLTIVFAIVYAAAWVQRMIYGINTYTGTYPKHGVGVLENMIYSDRWMAVAAAALAVLVLVSIFLRKTKEETGKKLLIGYLSVIGLLVLIGVSTFIYANIRKNILPDGSMLTKLVVCDTFGSYRGYVWIRIINMLKHAPFFNKLFGFGFSSMSTKMYEYNLDMNINSGFGVWADGHNTIMDLLASSGIIGVILFIGLFALLCVGIVKAIKKNEKMVLFLALLMAYLGASLINSNLIVTTPIIFMYLAIGNNYAHHLKDTDLR